MAAGYSGTPLIKKLGIKPGFKVFFYEAAPAYVERMQHDFPGEVEVLETPAEQRLDFIHAFFTSMEELEKAAPLLMKALKKTGMLWVSWPKGKSSIKTDLKREPVRECLLEIGLVDVKVAAIDEDWSGLKFVYRLKDR